VKPAPFDYVAPATVAETVEALARHGDAAKILAGGQSLVPMLNLRLARPSVVVDINGHPGAEPGSGGGADRARAHGGAHPGGGARGRHGPVA